MKKTTKMVAVLAAMSVMVLGAATMVSAAEKKNGWAKEGSDWYYYNDDKAIVNGWAQDSAGKWYFLGEQGKMLTERFVDDDAQSVVENVTDDINDGDNTKYYYVDKDGAMVTGWVKAKIGTKGSDGPTKADDTKWYFFGTDGRMYAEEWILSGSDWYWVNAKGQMATKTILVAPQDSDEDYYLDKNGVMVTGWHKVTSDDVSALTEGGWIYANASGELVKTGWEKVNSAWYYFGDLAGTNTVISGAAVTGTGADEYMMNSNTFIQVGNDIFHLKSSGAMSTGTFKYDDNNYFAKSDGTLQMNIQPVSGKYYFFDDQTLVRDNDSKYVVETLVDGDKVFAPKTSDDFATDAAAKAAATGGAKVYKLGTGTMWK